ATPPPFPQHPASQRFGIHLQPILRRQVFRRQRRSETLAHRPTVLLPHQPQRLLSELRIVSAIRRSPRAAVLQSRGPVLPIALPHPLRLPVAQPHKSRRIHHEQLLAPHPLHHSHSFQLPSAQFGPPQSDLL